MKKNHSLIDGVHLVLSGGGITVISYLGALEILKREGIKILSISCCSAGTILGGMFAAGMSLDDLKKFVLETDYFKLRGSRRYNLLINWLNWLRYPYAPYSTDVLIEVIDQHIGGELTLRDSILPFSTFAIDLYSRSFVVYSSEHHGDMKFSEVIRISTTLPGIWAPYSPNDSNRVIIDGGVACLSPVWLAPDFGQQEPILVLKTNYNNKRQFKENIFRFVNEMIESASRCWDEYLMDSNTRVQQIEIDCMGISPDSVRLAVEERQALIEMGRKAVKDRLPSIRQIWESNHSFPLDPIRMYDLRSQDQSVSGQTSARLLHRQQHVRPAGEEGRKKLLYISYAPEDQKYYDELYRHLSVLERNYNIVLWSHNDIEPSALTLDAIKGNLKNASMALLLTSADYFNDAYRYSEEFKYIKENKQRLNVLWVPVSAFDYEETGMTELPCGIPRQLTLGALPDEHRENIYKSLSAEIRRYVQYSGN